MQKSLAVKHSDVLIADSIAIQEYLNKKYSAESNYIPYGANVFQHPNKAYLNEFKVKPMATICLWQELSLKII